MMVHERNSDTLSSARQHKRLLRLFLVAAMLTMVVMAVPLFAFSSGSASAASSSGRPVSEPKLLPFAKSSGSQVDTPNWHAKSGFGYALVGSTPAGKGSSAAAIDEATDTIYVANGYNINGGNAGGNTISVIDGRRCQGVDASGCKGPWPTLTVGNEPASIAVDKATDTLYVTNDTDNTVSVVNGATCNAQVTSGCTQTPATVPVGAGPIGLFADDANHTVYIANFNNGASPSTMSLLNSATCNGSHFSGCPTTPLPTVALNSSPTDIDVNQSTHTVYVATLAGMSVFDANTCNASTTSGCTKPGMAIVSCVGSPTGSVCGPFTAKVDAANNTVYVSDGDYRVSVFDGRTCNASDLAGCATQNPGTVIVNGGTSFEVDIWVAVDVPLHSVYVSNQKDDYLAVIDTNVCNGRHLTSCSTFKPQTIHTGADPEIIALNQKTQTVYAPNQVDNTVSVINAQLCNASFTAGCRNPAPEVNFGGGVSAIAVDPAVQTAYVANDTNTVSMLNTSACNASSLQGCTNAFPTVAVGVSPRGIAVDSQTHTVYVANAGSGTTGTVSVIDATTCNAMQSSGCSKLKTLQVPGGNTSGLAINQATDTIYVATLTSSGPDIISVFNGATCNASHSQGCTQKPAVIHVGNSGGSSGSELSLAVNQTTNTIYATNLTLGNPYMGTSVFVINGATCDATNTSGCGQVPATITAGNNPWGIGIDEATDTIYTANNANGEAPGTASVINGATCNGTNTSGCGQTPSTVQTGFGAVGIVVDAATHHVYVSNVEDTSVSVINGSTCNGTNTSGCGMTPPKVAVGLTPFTAAIDQSVGTVYVGSLAGTVSVIPAV